MHAFGEQVGQRRIDRALTRDAALPLEGRADDLDGEMRFAARVMAGMPGMMVAVVDHREMRRREGFCQATGDFCGNGACRILAHRAYIGPMDGQGQANKRRQERFHGRVSGHARPCAHAGCEEAGEFRAPLRRETGGKGWQWLCLDHVRAFNARYNYFDGMSAEEIEQAQRPYAGWERETRAFAHAGASPGPRWQEFHDPLDAINAHFRTARPRDNGRPLSDSDRRNLKVMELEPDADRRALRTRYAELLRRYHPDHNGGDRSHEKRLQQVIAAYTALKGRPAFA